MSDIAWPVRLNRYISMCGEASRRGADELIASGRVTVDGAPASLGSLVHDGAVVAVDGREISLARRVYIAMNKPRGVLSAVTDERERTVLDLLPKFYAELGVFPVGRLDKDSEGLLILTNDGDFAQSVLHPSNEVPRTYDVLLQRPISEASEARLREGVVVDGRTARPLELARMGSRRYRIVLGEGFKREIRMMVREVGGHVERLRRVGVGKFFLEKLPEGSFCEYNHHEMLDLIFGRHDRS